MLDVVIIGGGVVGCAIARELSRYLLDTALIEKEVEVGFGTSKTNSGIIHAGHHDSPDSLKGRLVVQGNQLFDELHEELGFAFRRIGELVVAQESDDVPVLEALMRQGEEKGVPGLEIWDRTRLRREEPNLSSHLVAALYAPSAGVINPYEFAFALIENAVANGVELRVDSPVQGIDVHDGYLTVHTPHGSLDSRFVINCAGVFADRIAALVGLDDFSIHPRKGEEYLLDKRLQGVVRRLIFPLPTPTSKGILIIPTYDGTLMVGPTAEDTEDRYDLTTTAEGSEQVFRAVRRVCPSIDERATIAEFAGLRAVSDTDDFVIGPTRVRGFINVAGIQSPGLTAAPAIARHVLEILAGEGLRFVAKDSFDPHVPAPPRFSQQSAERRREMAAADPRFGKVVCRCELVVEGEIDQAIDHGARTLDGIKFRTRAGMGRCQSGFCAPRIMEMLAERLDVPLHAVTKRGGDSWMVLPMTRDGTAGDEGDRTEGRDDDAGHGSCSDA
jgi:glycerol-3-phosphate dehydrogenase